MVTLDENYLSYYRDTPKGFAFGFEQVESLNIAPKFKLKLKCIRNIEILHKLIAKKNSKLKGKSQKIISICFLKEHSLLKGRDSDSHNEHDVNIMETKTW